ncbi:unnamed protein product, partial [Urochloa humidicola]
TSKAVVENYGGERRRGRAAAAPITPPPLLDLASAPGRLRRRQPARPPHQLAQAAAAQVLLQGQIEPPDVPRLLCGQIDRPGPALVFSGQLAGEEGPAPSPSPSTS